MKKLKQFVLLLLLNSMFISLASSAQGLSNHWLIGKQIQLDTFTTALKCNINFTPQSFTISASNHNIFFEAAEANISDSNGNLLMSSNGSCIIDATGDTMLNGDNLFMGSLASDWSVVGLPIPNGCLFLPWPGDTSKYILFHQTGAFNLPLGCQIYTSIVDLNLNNGLGGVVNKNNLLPLVNPSWGLTACKHANGRDWWIIVLQDSSDLIYKLLLTPQGIVTISSQSFGSIITALGNASQHCFSPDGNHFAYVSNAQGNPVTTYIRYFDFDRCNGALSNLRNILTPDNYPIFGLCFSPNSRFLYSCSYNFIYQTGFDSLGFVASYDTVAVYDGYTYPYQNDGTTFFQMYRAANSKIYISSASPNTVDLSFINYPDSLGLLCNVQQHALRLPSYNSQTVPNHPNYFLGALEGSGCDTLSSNSTLLKSEQVLQVFPNPTTTSTFSISYVLAQNKTGLLQVIDVHGKTVHEQRLPPWSTYQQIEVPKLANGIYSLRLQSGDGVRRAKVVLCRE